jgi:hypothetical protein
MCGTEVLFETIRGFSPTVFLSQREYGYYSFTIGPSVKSEIEGCVEVGDGLAIAIYNCPEVKQTPEHALYDFSVRVSTIEEVRAVTYQIERNIIRVWSFIERRNKEIRKSIYEKEFQLMGRYNKLIFDFNVVVLKSDEPLIPQDIQGFITYYKASNGK